MERKVHVIEKYFIPVTAGIEVNILETYKVLRERGWDITVHTSRDTLTEKNCLPASDEIKGLKVKRYVYGFFGFWPRIDWRKVDFICLHNFNVFPHLFVMFFSLYLKISGKKKFSLFLTPHGGFNPEWSIFPPFVRVAKSLYHFTLGAVMVNLVVDGVRAVSEWEKEEMVKRGIRENLIDVIDNGIEDEAYVDLEKEASVEVKRTVEGLGRYMIQIGRIYVIKNYETVIRAMPELPGDLKYVIVGPIGDENYKSKLERLIGELGLGGRVIFTGVVKGADKFYLMKRAQMMVHMALWESFCNVVHEGLSQGLVCLVANNTALPYLIKDGINGWCIATKDSKELARKINYVLDHKDSEEILKMGERNREYGLRNSWRDVSGRMHDFYERVHLRKRYV